MTRSKAPPPINPVANRPHKLLADFGRLRKRAIETPPPGMADVRLTFNDEFSPSTAQAFTSDPDALHNPAARHIFYNQHLYDLLPVALSQAAALGMPVLGGNFPLNFAEVDSAALGHILAVSNWLASSLKEGTVDWLCVQCFVRYALLCNGLAEPSRKVIEAIPGESGEHLAFRQRSLDALSPVSEAFFLGAALRELELAILNRADALRGKRTKRAAKAGGEMRRKVTSPETDARRAEMERLIGAGHSIANAARLTANSIGGTVEANRALLKPGRRK